MGAWKRMYFMTPTFRPVGGVVKVFDYVNHSLSLGYEPIIACPEPYKATLPLFEIPRFSGIAPENGVGFTSLEKVAVGPDDLGLVVDCVRKLDGDRPEAGSRRPEEGAAGLGDDDRLAEVVHGDRTARRRARR